MIRRAGVSAICIALLVGAYTHFAEAAAPETKSAPKTVVDYYYLLPDDYFEIKRQARKDLLDPRNKPVIDIAHGYMLAPGDGAQPTLELALFKKKNGEYVVAVCHNFIFDEESDTFLDFYTYHGDHLVKVSGLLPEKIDGDLIYKLPRVGTSIRVEKANGKLVRLLAWNGEKFEKAK